MKFNIISNLQNGAGLQHDYELLKCELERLGHQVRGIQFNVLSNTSSAHVNIFLETVVPQVFSLAPQQWVVPNPEWWSPKWDSLPLDRVFGKTLEGTRVFTQKFGTRCEYLGWLSRDLLNLEVERKRRFLHVAGRSPFKNTLAVMRASSAVNIPVTMIAQVQPIPPIQRRRVSDNELRYLMNSHIFNLIPSSYEGYGHVLHEAMSVGQVVITTDAPPMNEVKPAILIPYDTCKVWLAGMQYEVSSQKIEKAMKQAMEMSDKEISEFSHKIRAQFYQENQEFKQRLEKLI